MMFCMTLGWSFHVYNMLGTIIFSIFEQFFMQMTIPENLHFFLPF